jgi:hypothetical protein
LGSIDWRLYPEYDAFIVASEAQGQTAKQIAEAFFLAFGLRATPNQISGRIFRLKSGSATGAEPPDTSPLAVFQRRVKLEQEKLAERAVAREMAAAVRGQARWEEFMDIVRGELSLVPDFEVPEPIVLPVASGTPEDMVLHITDPHAGKLVDPAQVGEGFEYGIPIFDTRLARLENRIVRLFLLQSQNAPIDRLQLYFTGDGVDGVDMRRGHAHRVDIQTATGQVLYLSRAFTQLTMRLRATLGVPIHWEWRYGNHGRVGEFGVNLPSDNWDYMAGKMLEDRFEAIPGVTINVPTTKTALTRLGPLTVLSGHGDGGRKGGGGYFGIPLGAIASNYVADVGLNQQLIDVYILGHWHQTMDSPLPLGGRVLMSSAWDGGDDYSVNNIKAASQPEQWAFGIHPERGITWQYRIQLAPKRQPTEVR